MPGNNNITKITGLSHEGRGIAHIEGKTVFVENALPDEVIEIEILKKYSRYNEAQIRNILEASPNRMTPQCIHFEYCGGCQLQHMNINAQIALKQRNFLEQLRLIGHVEPQAILAPLQGPAWGYRYKGRLSVKYLEKKQKLLIGFHEKNGRYVADLSRCEVLHPHVGLSIELLRTLILSLSISRFTPQIEIACDDTQCALIFRCLRELSHQDKNLFIQFGQKNNFWIYIEPNKPQALFKLWSADPQENLSYSLHFPQENNIIFTFHPKDFTQINAYINPQMVKLAVDLLCLERDDCVLDLFCGLGNFSLPIAHYCHHVTGIEGDKNMIIRAQQNAEKNHIFNTAFYADNLFDPDKNAPWIQKQYDKVLLDPPRTGAIEILPYISQWKPHLIVYVSCNPATLARDAGELVHKYGYTLIKTGIIDMFPHTRHVESITVFEIDRVSPRKISVYKQ